MAGGIVALAIVGVVLSAVFSVGPYVVTGIADGSIYALAALGLVLTYKTSGIFNFAIGAQAAASAYVFYSMRVSLGLPWPVAALVLGAPRRAHRLARTRANRLLADRGAGRHEGRCNHRPDRAPRILTDRGVWASNHSVLLLFARQGNPSVRRHHPRQPAHRIRSGCGCHGRPVSLLQTDPPWRVHARRGRLPDASRPRGHESGDRSPLRVGHRLVFHLGLRHVARPRPRHRRQHLSPRLHRRLRRRRGGRLHQPSDHFRGCNGDRHHVQHPQRQARRTDQPRPG